MSNLDQLANWQARLDQIADEMECDGTEDLKALAEHIDSINDDLEFQRLSLLEKGPEVTFRGGKCVVRYVSGN